MVEDSAMGEGAVVFRHAPVADSNPVTQPASMEEAQIEASPSAIVRLKEPVPSQAESTTIPSGRQHGD
jgi:hypothetical protein